MLLPPSNSAVWTHTTGSAFNALRPGGYGAFLTPAQQARVERIRQARLLFDGKHREYYLDEGRTQFNFPEVRAGERTVKMYLTHNVLGLISLKGADLLFGEEPLLRVEDELQQDQLAALVERSSLHALFYGAAVDASYEAECFLESYVADDIADPRKLAVYLRKIPADDIFPIGELGPDLQYRKYERYRVRNVATEQAPRWLLLVTTYVPGEITRKLYELSEGGAGRKPIDLAAWAAEGEAPPLDVEPTGIDRNTITWIPNLLLRGTAVSDYDGAIELQDALNAKNSQVGRVLLKHSDPKMAFPEAAFDEKGQIRSDADAFAYNDPEGIPKYITWDAQLDAAMQDRTFALNQLLVRTETSPVLLGLKEGAAPDAYKKVRLESFNSLTKAARKAVYWRAAIRRACGVARELELAHVAGTGTVNDPIGVEPRDGIPVDANEQAERQAVLKSAGLISTEGALLERLGDPAAVETEIAAIRAEQAATVPPILMGGQAAGLGAAATAAGAEPGETAGDDEVVGTETTTAAGPQTDAVSGNDLRGTVGALNAIRQLQIDFTSGAIERSACIANATIMLGLGPDEAAKLFPDKEPDPPGDPKPPAAPAPAAKPAPAKGVAA